MRGWRRLRWLYGMGLLLWMAARRWRGPFRMRWVLLSLVGAVVWFGARSGCAPTLRVGTFNVREFGPRTDRTRLIALLKDTNSDVLALQEIQDPPALGAIATALSVGTPRSYQAVVSQCGGQRQLHLGFLYDTARVRLDQLREFPELREDNGGSCSAGDRAGLLASFSMRSGFRETRTHVLTVHFPAGAASEQARRRQIFLQRALQIVHRVRTSGEDRVLLLGDLNTTDYREDLHGERSVLRSRLAQAGMHLLTDAVGCSAYWKPGALDRYVPGHLDHVIATDAIGAAARPAVQGFCAALQCEPTARIPADFLAVSDHCPVLVTIR